jgi:hypothetical protein
MRIFYVNTAAYEYLTAGLIEGLQDLGHTVRCTAESNYGHTLPADELTAFAEVADLVVAGSGAGVDYGLLERIGNPRRVFVDGGDFQAMTVPEGLGFKAVFKRELNRRWREAAAQRVFPLPFAAEKRYFVADAPAKDLRVSFLAFMGTNPLRHSVHQRLLNRGDPLIVSGSTEERAYNVRAPSPLPLETPQYRALLARSQISVSVPGLGYDCARYWEIPAAKAMLLAWEADIVVPNDFADGETCVKFASLAEFENKLEQLLARPKKMREIAERGHRHLLRYHTTAARAAYFLETALAQIA